jgi:hypothetical protein
MIWHPSLLSVAEHNACSNIQEGAGQPGHRFLRAEQVQSVSDLRRV